MWLVPRTVFVSYVFILLKKGIILATIHCSSWFIVEIYRVRGLLWYNLIIVLCLCLILTVHVGGFCYFGFCKKVVVMI